MAPFASFATEHTVSTVCPLDCPDSCSLDVVVQDGRISSIDGSTLNPVTGGYICAKVRRFPERVYGADRLLYPAIRKGPKGDGLFTRASWEEALALIAERLNEARERWGAESILPYLVRRIKRAAHPGHERRHAVPPPRHIAARTHGLRGADWRGQPVHVRQDGVRRL